MGRGTALLETNPAPIAIIENPFMKSKINFLLGIFISKLHIFAFHNLDSIRL